MRIALLSNVTAEFLGEMLKKNDEIYLPAGYDTWQREMMLPTSGLYAFRPEAVVVLLYANAYPDVWTDMDRGLQLIDSWCESIRCFTAAFSSVPVFVSSLDISNICCRYGAERKLDCFFEDDFSKKLDRMHADGASVYEIPVRETAAEMGTGNFYSAKMWYMGSMPYSMKGLSALQDIISRYASVCKGAKKKCLAVDLDNTLWGGVIGEDGVDGIVLSDNKEGARYKDAQRLLKKMKDQGVMLAILSKNNPEDVEPVYKHPDMILKHEDFVAESVNWESKTANIRLLAQDLNIGLDSFVFLDDNPAERERMKAECPEVSVIDFPKDSSLLPGVLARAYNDYFLKLEVTGEDLKKTAMYRSEVLRKEERQAAASVEDYLRNLGMKMTIHPMRPEEERRVTQLINKTNQFNLTTKRYSEEEVHAMATSSDTDVITVHMSDKYGEQGLVSVMILARDNEVAVIDSFLMSCRVMGRDAEKEILAQVGDYLSRRGIKTVKASFCRTAKNAPVLDLYDKLGFRHVSGEILQVGDTKEYEASVQDLPASSGVFQEVCAEL